MSASAFVCAVSHYANPAYAPLAFAAADARAVADALGRVGAAAGKLTLLVDEHATVEALTFRLRRAARGLGAGDTLYFFFAGHAFSAAGKGHLVCLDTDPREPLATSVPLVEVLSVLHGSGCGKTVLLLDAHPGGVPANPPPGGPFAPLDHGELADFCNGTPGRAVFASCLPGETPRTSGRLQQSIWSHHVLEVLSGGARTALEEGRRVSAEALQRHLERELPRTLRRTFAEPVRQTPILIGDTGLVVADLTPLTGAAGPWLDWGHLKRVTFRSERPGRVKELRGFLKSFDVPDRVTPGAERFIAGLAVEDIRNDLEERYAAIQQHLRYKRRDVEVGTGEAGQGSIRTPDFDYTVGVALNPADPASVIWRREVTGVRRPEVVQGPAFQAAFGSLFDALVFEFDLPIDVAALIDRLEAREPPGIRLEYPSDAAYCVIKLAAGAGEIRVERDRVLVRGPAPQSAAGIAEQFSRFQEVFGGDAAAGGAVRALPLPA